MKLKIIALFILFSVLPAAGTALGASGGGSGDGRTYPFQDVTLSLDARVADLVSRLTLDEKISILHSTADAVPRLGIQKYAYGNEGLHGVAGPGKFTVFPQAIALASTWDIDMVSKVSTAISDEAWGAINRDSPTKGYPGELFHVFWTPTINMARDPRWGRTAETYGEDPWLTSRFAVAFVKGLQGDDPKYIKVAATPKHFAANNEDHNRDYCNAKISETALREYYFPGFQAAVMEGNAQSVMGAYNAINGVPCNANKWLMVDVLRKDWGFDGYVVTDCGAPHLIYAKHQYVKTPAESAAMVLNAGVAVECGGDDILRTYMRDALKQGLVTEATIDRAITEAMKVRFRLGLFDPPELNPYTKISPSVIGSPEHMELARQECRESIVLLKNAPVKQGPLLPLDKKSLKSIAVVGPNAAVLQFGDYSGSPLNTPVTPLDGIKNAVGDSVKVNHVEWLAPPDEKAFTTVPADNFRVDETDGAARGLRAEYFDNADFTGTPAATRVDNEANLKPANTPLKPGGALSVRWSGKLIPTLSGAHYFYINASDDARLFIDGKLVLDKKAAKKKKSARIGAVMDAYLMEEKNEIRKNATVMLEAGKAYGIVAEYASPKGAAAARLDWAPPAADAVEARALEMKTIKESDVVIAFMGLQFDDEHETRDRHTLDISNDQTEYIKQALALNPNVVVVLINGGPVSINWINENAPAILEAWYPGEQGGNGIADVLFGDYNPAGRLSMTWHKSVDDLPPFDDYEVSKGRTYMYFDKEPLFPFGFGLSYTAFEYSGLALDKKRGGPDDTVNVTLNIKNTGARDGDEVAQLYVRAINPPVKRPLKQLRGFKRINIKKGETASVTFPLAIKNFAFWNDKSKKFEVEPGAYEIFIGVSSAGIRLKDIIEVSDK